MKAHKLFGKDKKQDDQTGLDTLSEEVSKIFSHSYIFLRYGQIIMFKVALIILRMDESAIIKVKYYEVKEKFRNPKYLIFSMVRYHIRIFDVI